MRALEGGWCLRSDPESSRRVDPRRTAWCGPDNLHFFRSLSSQVKSPTGFQDKLFKFLYQYTCHLYNVSHFRSGSKDMCACSRLNVYVRLG